ncbi:hypothetical protein MACH24_22250 [Erythrobacter sp. Dej080120_24]|nr:hypothetical protein MACH24_22250 [Erythrobacter sp. Dej080120_24]
MSFEPVIEVLSDTRKLVALPESDFVYSGWRDQADALQKIDNVLTRLEAGDRDALRDVELLFAPTGPLQELSLSSGWGNLYLVLAEKYDVALQGV